MDREKDEREAKLTERKTRGRGGSEVMADVAGRTVLSGGICCSFAAQ
jgi:hypothetical protein